LASAMGSSTNVVFAKLAKRSLDAASLARWAEKFRFNQPWSFAVPTGASFAKIPDDEFGLATTAAGFGEVFLSPLHGAAIAAAVGNRGTMVGPVLFEDEVPSEHRVVSEQIAAELSDMLERTVTSGTARQAFRGRGRYVLGKVQAAGKTGSLADKKPFRDYSWFVGWAPKEKPTIAVAAVVVNGPWWRVRAPYVAREALRTYLNEQAKQARREARRETLASR
ncbi:MAG: penicillin-binding transpeptidase domain-containing protein, partial [Myxococcales bacterium]